MTFMNQAPFIRRLQQIFVPVTSEGHVIKDNGGDVIGSMLTPAMAEKVAQLINQDAGLT